MKIKEVQAGVKVSRNYNSYSINLVADLEEKENVGDVGNILIEKAKEIIDKKMMKKENLKDKTNWEKENLKDKIDEEEVGAAWYSKNPGKLSVQYSKGGSFLEIDIKDLEEKGFVQNVNGETFVFRRIPVEKRKSNKMPVFRIYGGVKNE
ncbi:hypothetical protein HOD29_01565 [archaeon]|nr:hypothetical protein [archaeon]